MNEQYRGGTNNPRAARAASNSAYTSSNSKAYSSAPNGNGVHTHGRDNSKQHRRVIIVVAIIVAVLLAAYLIGAFIFSGRFFPNTTVNGIDVSMDTPEEVSRALDDSFGDYKLEVVGEGLNFDIDAQQAGLSLDSETVADNMMSDVNPWIWPVAIFGSHDETDALVVTYGEDSALTGVVDDKVNEFNATAVQPENATVVFDEPQGNFSIVGESIGTALDADKVLDAVTTKALQLAPVAELDESVLLQPRITSDNPDLISACNKANSMVQVNLQLVMADTVMGEVTPAVIAPWITFPTQEESTDESESEPESESTDESADEPEGEATVESESESTEESDDESEGESTDESEDESEGEVTDEASEEDTDEQSEQVSANLSRDSFGFIEDAYADETELDINDEGVETVPAVSATLDENAVYSWALEVTKNCDTVGTTRTYTRPDGKEITVSGGSYGWYTDTNGLKDLIINALYSQESGTLEIPLTQTGVYFNGIGTQDWGSRYIDLDLSEQHVYFYDSSSTIIWDSACVSGLPDGKRDTPTGVYYVYSKERDTYLEDEVKTYKTFVSYWMPFNGGVGFHDANWQPAFGGSQYRSTGSHGCVNLPPSAAANLYSVIEVGDVVVSHW